ncbi:MAG: DNA repair protein RadA [Bacteroidaceae bacterium]|jgi:DNA repair protein RadA/Sms|nr:DNA repair protein RadA [Bacteroidaceae bacterium]
MATIKDKTVFVCTECGFDSPKWSGKCPSCGMWNTMVEKTVRADKPSATTSLRKSASGLKDGTPQPETLDTIETSEEPRIDMRDAELNRVLGGGLVPGSIVLLGGEPGIGKSTLILQTVMQLKGQKVLYVSGEESARQIKMRADRLAQDAQDRNNDLMVLCETSLENIYTQIKETKPTVVVIDSIQTISSEYVESSAGSLTQVRECAASLLKFAKESGTPVLLIGHITKDGTIAGPKILEHIVDAVLQFEGDQHYLYRILRPIKNRFGSTSELGIYEMRENGLRQVSNPSELLLTDSHQGMSGVSIACTIEGVRPFLIEVQALASTAVYGTPQRSAIGFDVRRMNMLLAVLEKRVGFKLGQKDVFLNIAGGLKVSDPAIDLAVISAILSSSLDIAIDRTVCMAGEVGLSGEIRPVSRIEQRIAEAGKLGFERIIIPSANMHGLNTKKAGIKIVPVSKVEEAFKQLFG